MPVKLSDLRRKAKERGWKCDTQTIKIPDDTHPFSANVKNFNIEINYSDKEFIWFGFSINSDKDSKKEIALSLQEICMKKLLNVVGEKRKLHEKNGFFDPLKKPYIYYGAKVNLSAEKALNELKQLFEDSRDIQIPD